MWSSGPSYPKLKTNLKLGINRIKLLARKKTELSQKSRKEIADYIAQNKVDRARIRVEHIIREDYMVEAMEMLEMYCDLLLARFGLIEQMKQVDPGLQEAIASVIWAAPRLVADLPELKPICDQLLAKYGKDYPQKSKDHVNDKFQHRLGVQAPSKVLVEQYLVEISKNFNVPFEPDARVMKEAETADFLDLSDIGTNNLGGGGGVGQLDPPGFRGYPAPPLLPTDFQAFNFPPGGPQPSVPVNIGGFVPPIAKSVYNPSFSAPSANLNIPVNDDNAAIDANPKLNIDAQPPAYSFVAPDIPDDNRQTGAKPKPIPRGKLSPPDRKPQNTDIFPELPDVPNDLPGFADDAANSSNKSDDIDFDDLNRRFQNLKKQK